MNLVFYDFETTDSNPETCLPVQLGMIKAVINKNEIEIEKEYCTFIQQEDAVFSEEAVAKCHITPKDLEDGISEKDAIKKLYIWTKNADAVVGYNNRSFDEVVAQKTLQKYSKKLPKTPQIDLRFDIIYPEKVGKCRVLSHLCVEHGIFIKGAHNALVDCKLLVQLLECYVEDFDTILKRATSKKLKVKALVGYDDNYKAKELGYFPEYINGKFNGWFKELAEFDLKDHKKLVKSKDFKIEVQA